MYCCECGGEVSEDATFCRHCGTPTNEESQPEQTPAERPTAPELSRKKMPRGAMIGIIVAVVALIAAIIGGGLFIHDKQEQERLHSTHAVTLVLTLENYNPATDTRIPLQITGTDVDGAACDELVFVDTNVPTIDLVAGEYDVAFPASPLTESGAFYQPPVDPIHIVISRDLDKDAPVPSNECTIIGNFVPIALLDITDEALDIAQTIANQDPNDDGRANNNRTSTANHRQVAIDEAAAAAAAAEAAARAASFQAQLDELDRAVTAGMTEKRADGLYEIHTTGVFASACSHYTKQYNALAESILPFLSDEARIVAMTENSAVGRSVWATGNPTVTDALSIHVDLNKSYRNGSDDQTVQGYAFSLLRARDLCVRYLAAL